MGDLIPILSLAGQQPRPHGRGLDEHGIAGLLASRSSYSLRLAALLRSGLMKLSCLVTAALPHGIHTRFPILPPQAGGTIPSGIPRGTPVSKNWVQSDNKKPGESIRCVRSGTLDLNAKTPRRRREVRGQKNGGIYESLFFSWRLGVSKRTRPQCLCEWPACDFFATGFLPVGFFPFVLAQSGQVP
jgi:hypothetical protein